MRERSIPKRRHYTDGFGFEYRDGGNIVASSDSYRECMFHGTRAPPAKNNAKFVFPLACIDTYCQTFFVVIATSISK